MIELKRLHDFTKIPVEELDAALIQFREALKEFHELNQFAVELADQVDDVEHSDEELIFRLFQYESPTKAGKVEVQNRINHVGFRQKLEGFLNERD